MSLKFEIDSDNNWKLYNKYGLPELTSFALKAYTDSFDLDSIRKTYGSVRVLIVGGANLHLITELYKRFNKNELEIHLVDKDFSKYVKYYSQMYQENLNLNHIKIYEKSLDKFLKKDLPSMSCLFDLMILDYNTSFFLDLDTTLTLIENNLKPLEVRYCVKKEESSKLRDFLQNSFISYLLNTCYIPTLENTLHVYSYVYKP